MKLSNALVDKLNMHGAKLNRLATRSSRVVEFGTLSNFTPKLKEINAKDALHVQLKIRGPKDKL